MASSFLTQPPINASADTSEEAEPVAEKALTPMPIAASSHPRRATPPPHSTPACTAAAAVDVADVLCTSQPDLPGSRASRLRPPAVESVRRSSTTSMLQSQPTPGLKPTISEQVRRSSSVYLPPRNQVWTTVTDDTIERRLGMAVADALGLDSEASLPRDESFVDLGGNHQTARTLRATCKDAGLAIKIKDILSSKTLAELETHVTLVSPSHQGRTASPSVMSPPMLSSPINKPNAPGNVDPVRSGSPDQVLASPSAPTPYLQPKSSKRYKNQVEQVLSLNGDVAKAVLLKPRAGLFEGETVALVTLRTFAIDGPDDCDIKLLAPYYGSKLAAIRRSVEPKIAPSLLPDVWIALERMPLGDDGKVNRRKLQTWVQNANEGLHQQILSVGTQESVSAPMTDVEKRLHKAVARVLNISPDMFGMDRSFLRLGGDATTAMQLVVRCKSQGISLKTENVLQALSLSQLAATVLPGEEQALPSVEMDVAEEFQLSPMQRLYFHTSIGRHDGRNADRNGSRRFNTSIFLRFRKHVAVEDVRASMEAIVGHHAMLRARFRHRGGSWSQFTRTDIPSSYHFGHHTVGTDAQVQDVITQAQANIDIEHGPIFAAHHFHTNDGYQMLYLIAHHLVVDSKSWSIIANDLNELLTDGNFASERVLSFEGWVSHQMERVKLAELGKVLPINVPTGSWKYWGLKEVSNTYGSATVTGFVLESAVTHHLEDSNRMLRTDTSEIFMAALLLSFCRTFRDRPAPMIWNQEHDRAAVEPELDVSETVGWFISLCPLVLTDISPDDDMLKVLCKIKDSRRVAAAHGAPYFAANLADAKSADAFVSTRCPLEIIFTCAEGAGSLDHQTGVLEQLSAPCSSLASLTSDIGPEVGRIAAFEVSAAVNQGEVTFKFLYHREIRHQALIQEWVREYQALLRKMIDLTRHCAPELSMTDLPALDVTYEGLTKLNREVLPNMHVDVRNIENIYPVSAKQQTVLINESLLPGSAHSHTIYRLNTLGHPVDVDRICAAWHSIVDKHPALRTVFIESVSKHGLFDQVIISHHSPNMLFLESHTEHAAMEELEKLPHVPTPKGSPPHRLVVSSSPASTSLKLEVSQALCDAASLAILFIELEEAYFNNALPITVDVSYPEYLQCLEGTSSSAQFWREALADVQPCRFPKLASEALDGKEWENTSIDLGLPHEPLETFALQHDIEVSAVLRVAWALVLRAYTGSGSVCFGYQISGRGLPVDGLAFAVGCFSSTLICSLGARSSRPIMQLLADSERLHREALGHQQASVSSVEHALGIKGALFNTCLSLGYENIEDLPADAKLRHVQSMQASEFDINVDVNFRNGNIALDVGHRILTAGQATNIAHVFGRAIETILGIPDITVRDVDLFSERDHQQILEWNSQPQADIPREHIPQLIACHAMENPGIEAVCAWDGDLTYAELDENVMALAHYLMACGIRPQMPVPVIVEKSRWALVAMLAVLSIGAILVPVDAEAAPTFAWVVKKVGAKLIVASESVREHLVGIKAQVVFLREIISCLTAPATRPVLYRTRNHDIACILFISITTGNDRGVAYSHGALATACAGQGPKLRINASSRVLQLSSYGIDISLSEIFTTLINGGCVCVPPDVERVSSFTRNVQRMNVNWTYLTPCLSRRLHHEELSNLAVVCFRTHQLDPDTYEPWLGKARVLLAYGSAQVCPLGLSAHEVQDASAGSCIGTPFCGNYWVVSPHDSSRLMPVGAVGELVVGSPTLATDFLLGERVADQLTGQNMDSATSDSGRLLKTGQLARYRERGQIESVPANNSKAELASQVEPRLRSCLGRGVEAVVDMIAFNHRDNDSSPILAAFIELGDTVFHAGQDLANLSPMIKERLYLAKVTVERSLRDVVPRHMIPHAFIPVKRMPLTPSLKVDRHKLQKMISSLSKTQLLRLSEVANPQEVQTAALRPLPLTQAEERVRTIMASVLGIKESSIAAGDGFLSLGGNRDLAHDLIIACRSQGLAVSVVEVLQNRILSEVCRGITLLDAHAPASTAEQRSSLHLQQTPPRASIVDAVLAQMPFGREEIEEAAETSALQTMFVESAMVKRKGNADYLVITTQGSVAPGRLEQACALLTASHPILRTAFVPHNLHVYQVVLRSHTPVFQRYQCPSWRLSNLTTKLVKKDQETVVDLGQPTTKFILVDAGKSCSLVIRLSRAQYSDTTLPVLVRSLCQLYDNPSMAAVHRVGFCDVVRAALETTRGGAEDYWKTLLHGSSMTQVVAQLAPLAASTDSKAIHRVLPTGFLQNLGIPFETILKGAWSIVLSNLADSADVVFGHVVEGKHVTLPDGRPAIDVVGPTGNIIPVRVRLPDGVIKPFEFFRAVQSQHIASVPHENMPFTEIMRRCTDWPSWTRFSTVVQHQAEGEGDDSAQFLLGSATCKVTRIESKSQSADLLVRSTTTGDGHVHVSLSFCEQRVQHLFADEVLKMLCSTISLLTSAFVTEPVTLRGLNDNAAVPRIPLVRSRRDDLTHHATLPSPVVLSVLPDHASAIHAVISDGWETILDAHALRVPDVRSVPFWNVWPSLVVAAELARVYSDRIPRLGIPGLEGASFSAEDVLEHPTMMAQYEMVIARQQRQKTGLVSRRGSMARRTGSVWNKNIGRMPSIPSLALAGPSVAHPSPPLSSHVAKNSNGNMSSVESMTTGSSQSEEEEPGDEVGQLVPVPKQRTTTKPDLETSGVRKRSSLLSKMRFASRHES